MRSIARRAIGGKFACCSEVVAVQLIFKNPMTTAAAIDRLVHHSVILEFAVPSYRSEKAKPVKNEKPRPQRR
jgi:DNA replication protein DnaC